MMTDYEWRAALAAGCSPEELSDEEPEPEMAADEPPSSSFTEDPCPF